MLSLKTKFEMNSRSRAVLILDKSVYHLEAFLTKKNFRVFLLRDGEDIQSILSNRILVTNNPKPYLEDSTVYEFSIISTEKVQNESPEKIADIISQAFLISANDLKEVGTTLILDAKHNHKILTYY